MDPVPVPIELNVQRDNRTLQVVYDDATYELSFEYLRVYSPSAEVQGHSPEEYKLQVGKKSVGINSVEMRGNYAVAILFDDGHSTGIYTWEWLHRLCREHDDLWAKYLQALEAAGESR